MINWYLSQKLWVKILLPLGLVCVIVLAFIFIPKYTGPEPNCVFIGERANLHDEYYVTVNDAYDLDSIYIFKNKEDSEKSELIGSAEHYVCVHLTIEHQNVANPKENHELDEDDFKLKDHTGVQIGKLNLFSKEKGLALETTNFSTLEPIVDYSWLGKEIASGYNLEIYLYFRFSKSISVNNTVMVLESDFIRGHKGNKAGTDIVLAYRSEQ